MDELKALAEAIVKNTKKNKTNAYETLATVLRLDGEKVYVHIDGGAPETPATATMACKEGDTVRIHVEGGKAWVIGNVSAPATDDTAANTAHKAADTAQATAEDSAKTATNFVTEKGTGGQILVHPEGDTKNAVLIGQDVQIIRNGTVVATYSDDVRIGKEDSAHAGISESGMAIYSAGGTDKVAEFGDRIKIGGAENYIELIPNPSASEDSLTICTGGKYTTFKVSEDDVYSSITGKHLEFSVGSNLTEAPYNISIDSHSSGILAIDILGALNASGRVTSGKESTEIALSNGASGSIYLHRKGDIASVYITGAKLGAGAENRTIATLPEGWRPVRQTAIPIDGSSDALLFINSDGTISCRYNSSTQRQIWGRVTYIAWA